MNPESNRKLTLLIFASALLVPVALSGQAPGPQPAGGLWLEATAAAGGARLTCAFCDRSRDLGPSLGFAVGAYASPRLRVGIESGAWTHEDGDVREYVYRAGITGQLHPSPVRGLHFIGGLGWSGYRAEEITYDAFRVTVGAGWDLPLSASWIAGNRVTLDGSSFGKLRSDGATIQGAGGEPLSVGLSVLRFEVYVRRR